MPKLRPRAAGAMPQLGDEDNSCCSSRARTSFFDPPADGISNIRRWRDKRTWDALESLTSHLTATCSHLRPCTESFGTTCATAFSVITSTCALAEALDDGFTGHLQQLDDPAASKLAASLSSQRDALDELHSSCLESPSLAAVDLLLPRLDGDLWISRICYVLRRILYCLRIALKELGTLCPQSWSKQKSIRIGTSLSVSGEELRKISGRLTSDQYAKLAVNSGHVEQAKDLAALQLDHIRQVAESDEGSRPVCSLRLASMIGPTHSMIHRLIKKCYQQRWAALLSKDTPAVPDLPYCIYPGMLRQIYSGHPINEQVLNHVTRLQTCLQHVSSLRSQCAQSAPPCQPLLCPASQRSASRQENRTATQFQAEALANSTKFLAKCAAGTSGRLGKPRRPAEGVQQIPPPPRQSADLSKTPAIVNSSDAAFSFEQDVTSGRLLPTSKLVCSPTEGEAGLRGRVPPSIKTRHLSHEIKQTASVAAGGGQAIRSRQKRKGRKAKSARPQASSGDYHQALDLPSAEPQQHSVGVPAGLLQSSQSLELGVVPHRPQNTPRPISTGSETLRPTKKKRKGRSQKKTKRNTLLLAPLTSHNSSHGSSSNTIAAVQGAPAPAKSPRAPVAECQPDKPARDQVIAVTSQVPEPRGFVEESLPAGRVTALRHSSTYRSGLDMAKTIVLPPPTPPPPSPTVALAAIPEEPSNDQEELGGPSSSTAVVQEDSPALGLSDEVAAHYDKQVSPRLVMSCHAIAHAPVPPFGGVMLQAETLPHPGELLADTYLETCPMSSVNTSETPPASGKVLGLSMYDSLSQAVSPADYPARCGGSQGTVPDMSWSSSRSAEFTLETNGTLVEDTNPLFHPDMDQPWSSSALSPYSMSPWSAHSEMFTPLAESPQSPGQETASRLCDEDSHFSTPLHKRPQEAADDNPTKYGSSESLPTANISSLAYLSDLSLQRADLCEDTAYNLLHSGDVCQAAYVRRLMDCQGLDSRCQTVCIASYCPVAAEDEESSTLSRSFSAPGLSQVPIRPTSTIPDESLSPSTEDCGEMLELLVKITPMTDASNCPSPAAVAQTSPHPEVAAAGDVDTMLQGCIQPRSPTTICRDASKRCPVVAGVFSVWRWLTCLMPRRKPSACCASGDRATPTLSPDVSPIQPAEPTVTC